jgi:hypothetical protein
MTGGHRAAGKVAFLHGVCSSMSLGRRFSLFPLSPGRVLSLLPEPRCNFCRPPPGLTTRKRPRTGGETGAETAIQRRPTTNCLVGRPRDRQRRHLSKVKRELTEKGGCRWAAGGEVGEGVR